MFFWTRSFLCIGTVVALAAGRSALGIGTAATDGALALAGSGAGTAVMRLCRDAPNQCMTLARESLAGPVVRDATGSLVRKEEAKSTGERHRASERHARAAPAL